MAMFMGEYLHNIDAKGRLTLPAKFREQLSAKVIVTRGVDGCLTIYPQPTWEALVEKLMQLPTTKKEARMYVHLLMAKACECEIDGQGRILISSALIKEAKLMKQCAIVGAANKIEIWDQVRWEEYYSNASENFGDIAEAMTDFVI